MTSNEPGKTLASLTWPLPYHPRLEFEISKFTKKNILKIFFYFWFVWVLTYRNTPHKAKKMFCYLFCFSGVSKPRLRMKTPNISNLLCNEKLWDFVFLLQRLEKILNNWFFSTFKHSFETTEKEKNCKTFFFVSCGQLRHISTKNNEKEKEFFPISYKLELVSWDLVCRLDHRWTHLWLSWGHICAFLKGSQLFRPFTAQMYSV